MMPDKKKKLIITIVSIIAIILLVIVISSISSFIKDRADIGRSSDLYPEELMYFGIIYDKENEYQNIIALNEDFESLEYEIKSFYKIQDIKVSNEKLLIYSDALNEIAYDKEKDEFYLNEIDSYYNANTNVYLAKDYMVFLTKDGSLEYILYDHKEKDKNIVIVSELENKNIAVIDNCIYYRDFEGIIKYNMETLEKKVVVPTSVNFSPEINYYNDSYILLKSNDENMILSVESDSLTKFVDMFLEPNYNLLSLYDEGFIYSVSNPNKLISYNNFYHRHETSPYLLEDNLVPYKMFHISGSMVYLDLVSNTDKHSYYVYDAIDREYVATLDKEYESIIKVR